MKMFDRLQSPFKEELIEAFSIHESKVAEFKAATTLLKNSQAEEEYAHAKDFTAELEEVDQLKVQLSALIIKIATEKAAAEETAQSSRANSFRSSTC